DGRPVIDDAGHLPGEVPVVDLALHLDVGAVVVVAAHKQALGVVPVADVGGQPHLGLAAAALLPAGHVGDRMACLEEGLDDGDNGSVGLVFAYPVPVVGVAVTSQGEGAVDVHDPQFRPGHFSSSALVWRGLAGSRPGSVSRAARNSRATWACVFHAAACSAVTACDARSSPSAASLSARAWARDRTAARWPSRSSSSSRTV